MPSSSSCPGADDDDSGGCCSSSPAAATGIVSCWACPSCVSIAVCCGHGMWDVMCDVLVMGVRRLGRGRNDHRSLEMELAMRECNRNRRGVGAFGAVDVSTNKRPHSLPVMAAFARSPREDREEKKKPASRASLSRSRALALECAKQATRRARSLCLLSSLSIDDRVPLQ